VAALTYPEAIFVGLMQGVTALFPVSSLGHSVLLPALVGGRWAGDLSVSTPESPYLAFIVGLHVATATALGLFYWRDWVRIATGMLGSLRTRRIATPDQRLAWLIVLATIPVGLTGLLLEHTFRTVLGRPVPAAIFLMVNGLVLLGGEHLRARGEPAVPAGISAVAARGQDPTAGQPSLPTDTTARTLVGGHRHGAMAGGADDAGMAADRRLARLGPLAALLIGAAQSLALLPGISRSGVTMVAGLARGLSHEDAARFAFLLATPVILAAGLLKLPDLAGPLGAGIRGQVLAGSIASGVGAYLSVRFLTRYFTTRTLTPFAVYSLLAGAVGLALLVAR
jgi:undecaprenyl-diphosphatase